ncbi:MAG: protein-L-isoaspartate O-methyltransferase [Verrucomicrobia bacterium]|jgi:protein-L-isoaspartate(D-aspartate) O-methyltransferase|nr:protein-L-isoaspartate O-methyltransferase [Verrucomicrobiota bacterium]
MHLDSYKHKGLRIKLIELLRSKGIDNEGVLKAINKVPRHLFLDNAFVKFAYQDQAFPIGANQTISQPFTVAFQSQLLDAKRGQKVLEIGTGSGFQSCVLMELGLKVFSIERHRSLHQSAKKQLEGMGYFPRLFFGDGYQGLATFAPFDRILITAAAPYIPEALKSQLKLGGKMVIPLGEGDKQEMQRITKVSETEFNIERFGDFSFVPMLQDKSFGKTQ